MSKGVLYFPYINIPKNEWTIQSLLYWDKVGIIVPPDYRNQPQQYEPYTRELLQSDLIQEVVPNHELRELQNLDTSFLKFIRKTSFRLEKRQHKFKKGSVVRIHAEKFGEDVFEYLISKKLAILMQWPWYAVEKVTARNLMVYLAGVLAKKTELIPTTDDPRNLDTSLSQITGSYSLSLVRDRLIKDLIPYPIQPNLTKLRRFKDKYHEQLTSFRTLLEIAAFDINSLNKRRLQEQKHELILEHINDCRSKILRDLEQSRLGKIVFGTICGLTGGTLSLVAENKPAALFSFANAVYSAFDGYSGQAILEKNYAYLALVDRAFKST